MNIAIIPARAGSKRIPRKNIKALGGIPIISRAIAALRASESFDRIVVSSDDREIQKVACQAGAEVLFNRPEALSDDFTPTLPVIRHAIDWLTNTEQSVNLVACVYPTSAFVTSDDYVKAVKASAEAPNSFVVAVNAYPHPIQRALRISPEGELIACSELAISNRSQDLQEHYHDAGQFYIANAQTWRTAKDILSHPRNIPILLRKFQAVDIDTSEDWSLAELIYQRTVSRREDFQAQNHVAASEDTSPTQMRPC
jgi:pseudaminic acid cytidylyltransferase